MIPTWFFLRRPNRSFRVDGARWRTLAAIRAAAASVLMLAFTATAYAEAPSLEYQVKASYLFNFARFIDWPNDVLTKSGVFTVCVIGAERFGTALDQLAGEHIEGYEITVRRIERPANARAARCQILYIGAAADVASGSDRVVVERGLLTVGESSGFVERGGIINLVEVDGRVRFEINYKAAQQAGLLVSSRLLSLALKR